MTFPVLEKRFHSALSEREDHSLLGSYYVGHQPIQSSRRIKIVVEQKI